MSSSIPSPSSDSSTPDYKAPSFRGALMCDHWIESDAEFSTVNASSIAEVSRASVAVNVLARLVHNSISEPSMSGGEPLGEAAHLGLLSAMEIIGTYLGDVAATMRACAARHANSATVCSGANHD